MAIIRSSLFSPTLLLTVSVDVAMPQDESRRLPDRRLPVLWLLHGEGGDQSSWSRNVPLERLASAAGIAIVMPAGENGFWTNMRYGFRWFDFLTLELPAALRGMLPLSASREDNALAGVGMGAYGALKAGLSFPDTYGAAGCFSGGNLPAGPEPARLPPGATQAMASVAPRLCFGIDGAASPYDMPAALERPDDPFRLADGLANEGGARAMAAKNAASVAKGGDTRRSRLPKVFLSTGTDDPFVENFRLTRDRLAAYPENPFGLESREPSGGRDWETVGASLSGFIDFAFARA